MSLVDPFQEARRRKVAQPSADTAFLKPPPKETSKCRKCVNTGCRGEMTLAASRGHRVLICMSCMTSLPVTADWQITGAAPPKGEAVEKAGSVAGAPIDVHQALKRKDMELSASLDTAKLKSSDTLDVSWLKPAAAKLNISPSIKDYVMVPVILFYANVPNRNGLGFLTKDLVDWSTEYKVPRYKSWRGAPMHIEHDNTDPKKAIGVVLDTFLRKHEASPTPFWKNIAYLAVDRGKNPKVAKQIVNKEISTYSMGAYIHGGYVCSVCEKSSCGHIVAPTAKKKYISLIENGVATDSSGMTRTSSPCWMIAQARKMLRCQTYRYLRSQQEECPSDSRLAWLVRLHILWRVTINCRCGKLPDPQLFDSLFDYLVGLGNFPLVEAPRFQQPTQPVCDPVS